MIAYFLKDLENGEVLMCKNADKSLNVASLIKVLYALVVADGLRNKSITSKLVRVNSNLVEGYGTDVLSDLVGSNNKISIDLITLVGLMLKYSCNSSTKIIVDEFIGNRKSLQSQVQEKWGLKKTFLINNTGNVQAKSSLTDLSIIFEKIYSNHSDVFLFIQRKLKESRNIYYLLDRQKTNVLGSKSGTVFIDDEYWLGNCAIIEIGKKSYFLGAVASSKDVAVAVGKLREVGAKMIKLVS